MLVKGGLFIVADSFRVIPTESNCPATQVSQTDHFGSCFNTVLFINLTLRTSFLFSL